MNPDILQRWVAALRSGNYDQTTGMLRSNKGYCSMGVLCDVLDSTAWKKAYHGWVWNDMQTALPIKTAKELGLVPTSFTPFHHISVDGTTLAHLNDIERLSFSEIADLLEAHSDTIY